MSHKVLSTAWSASLQHSTKARTVERALLVSFTVGTGGGGTEESSVSVSMVPDSESDSTGVTNPTIALSSSGSAAIFSSHLSI